MQDEILDEKPSKKGKGQEPVVNWASVEDKLVKLTYETLEEAEKALTELGVPHDYVKTLFKRSSFEKTEELEVKSFELAPGSSGGGTMKTPMGNFSLNGKVMKNARSLAENEKDYKSFTLSVATEVENCVIVKGRDPNRLESYRKYTIRFPQGIFRSCRDITGRKKEIEDHINDVVEGGLLQGLKKDAAEKNWDAVRKGAKEGLDLIQELRGVKKGLPVL